MFGKFRGIALIGRVGFKMERMNEERWQSYERATEAICLAMGDGMDQASRIKVVVDVLWEEFGEGCPVSWVGFYRLGEGEMVLGYCRDKPACSPIGLHGACGKVGLSGESLIVRDVRELGGAYISCDPRDLSEVVVPVYGRLGEVIGVLDVDSFSVGAFGLTDQVALEGIVAKFLGEI